MTIGIDISPLKNGHYLQHRVRGTGFYLQNLQKSLEKYYPDNKYIPLSKGESLSEQVDLVHYPYFEPFFLTLPLFSNNKKVVTVHDLTPLVFPQHFEMGLRGKLKWQMQKALLGNSNAIITDSMSSKKDISKFTGIKDARITVIYLAAGDQFRRINNRQVQIDDLRRKYHLPDKFALYVGDVTWNKNLPRLIEAIRKIDVPLVMVGKALTEKGIDLDNSWNKDLAHVREKVDGNKNVVCLGFVSSEDLVLLYNAASVFVMPSLYEGFGLPVLEAMSCGCPVVTSKEGSIPEVAGGAVAYVNAYDSDSIAKGISEVIGNPSLQAELSEKGMSQSKKFTWRKTAGETMSVYKKIANNNY